MKTLLTLLFLFLSVSLFAQNRIIFSIGMGYKAGIEQKIDKYFEKHKDKYELIFVCPQQKIYVVETKIETFVFIRKMINRFNVQFILKEEKDITDSDCLKEYKALKNKRNNN